MVALCFMACTKSSLDYPVVNKEHAGGESVNSIEKWTEKISVDSALSTMSGAQLLEHLKGLSQYMENVSEKINVEKKREISIIHKLPAREIQLKTTDRFQLFLKYMELQRTIGSNTRIFSESVLPFQSLSNIAIQLHIIQLKNDSLNKGVDSTGT